MIAIVFLFACLVWGPLLATAATAVTWAYRKTAKSNSPESASLVAVFCVWYFAVVVFIVGASIITGAADAPP